MKKIFLILMCVLSAEVFANTVLIEKNTKHYENLSPFVTESKYEIKQLYFCSTVEDVEELVDVTQRYWVKKSKSFSDVSAGANESYLVGIMKDPSDNSIFALIVKIKEYTITKYTTSI